MLGGWTVSLLFWVLSTLCLIYVSAGFSPPDNYLIDCGSLSKTTVGNRLFLADDSDSSILETPQKSFVNTSSSAISSIFGSSLYQTARIFNGISHYNFSIKKQGRHWVRLYFFPFVSENRNLSAAKFSVTAQSFTLLKDHQVENGPKTREFSLNINSDSLVLTFTPSSNSFAFLNALEVVSQPDELIPEAATLVGSQESDQNLQKLALETVVRVNMGNESVSPQNDTLSRFWAPDGSYLTNSHPKFVSNIAAVNFTRGFSNETIAPASVYGTATMLDIENDPRVHANVTWNFDVNPGFEYLVRFHFCYTLTKVPSQSPQFKVYLDSWLVSTYYDISHQASNTAGAPYYKDAIVKVTTSSKLRASVGPYNSDVTDPVFLNGLEIMKMSNSKQSFDASDAAPTKSSKTKIVVLAGLVAVLFVAAVFAIVVFLLCRRRRRRLALVGHSKTESVPVNGIESKYTNGTANFCGAEMVYRFPLCVIQEATDNFSENLVIGVGGFGKVYEGVLRDNMKVAVKRGATQSKQGLAEFRTEIKMLSQFRHRHLVSLIGYCDEQNEMIIVYEFMQNGTLKNHLYGSDFPCLSWRQRLQICIGSARGLHYLHTGPAKAIIHRDVKSANILLDENFMAKVADFGLSKTGPEIDQTHVSTAVKGSFGYLDPEYLTMQQLTEKSDVYSFGVVMLEVLCGRPVIDPSLSREKVNLIEWAMKHQKEGQLEEIVDPFLASQIKPESLHKFGELVEKCLAERGLLRPTMGDVLWNLEYVLQLQGVDERPDGNGVGELSAQLETSEPTAEISSVSLGDLDGISMSTVFAQLVKEDKRQNG